MPTNRQSNSSPGLKTAHSLPDDGVSAAPSLHDALDRSLVALLQANARESATALARKLGVARTTVVARIARLERDRVIVGYTVRLAHEVTDQGIQAQVGITVEPKASREVVRKLTRMPELRRLSTVSGEFDLIAELAAATPTRLDAMLDEIGAIEGVVRTTTSVILAVRVDRTAA